MLTIAMEIWNTNTPPVPHHPHKWGFFPISPKGIWEMEISKARQMAENNMYELRMSQCCTQEI